jgi:7-carboxy-7-deazaguanine synthase
VEQTPDSSKRVAFQIRELKMVQLPLAYQGRLEPLRDKPAGQLLVHEIYRSIQGESTFAGLPCVFVRLTTCMARCSWCDTPHAFREGTARPLEGALKEVLAFGCPLVELTGGEPLLQPEAFRLMTMLADAGKTVLLETSGLIPIEGVDPRVHIVMDLKCPDSGECENNRWDNLALLKPTDQIKFVIASRRDFDWTVDTIRRHRLDSRFTVLLSAALGSVQPVELVGWLLESRLQVRMQLQLHKYIWPPDARGV